MSQFITDEQFDHFFSDGFLHTAWRLETRRAYASDRRGESYRRFLRGEDPQTDPDRPWCENVRAQVALGKRIERVRIADDPISPGQAYLVDVGRTNVAAGEDIRHLPRDVADELKLPPRDFWLFDSRVVLLLHFDEDDVFQGAQLVEDPEVILEVVQVRDAAWHHAVPRAEFAEQLPSRV